MGRVNEWAVNKDSDGIVYCFADGTTQVVCLEDYLRENPEYTAADFRQIKEISDGMFYEHNLSSKRYAARVKIVQVKMREFPISNR